MRLKLVSTAVRLIFRIRFLMEVRWFLDKDTFLTSKRIFWINHSICNKVILILDISNIYPTIRFQFHIDHFHSEVARKILPLLMLIQTILMAGFTTKILLFDLNHQTKQYDNWRTLNLPLTIYVRRSLMFWKFLRISQQTRIKANDGTI